MVDLLEVCRNLQQKIEKLEAEIENLKAENKALRIENAELRERLGLNSQNSSIPSSKELYKIKKGKPKSNINDIFNLNISVGSVSNSEARVVEKCKEAYEQVEQEVSKSEILHIDETSHYNRSKLGWCWMFSSNEASFVKLTNSRGMKVLENSAFGKNVSLVVTDRYTAYNYFSSKKRQICWAHLARDFERLSHN